MNKLLRTTLILTFALVMSVATFARSATDAITPQLVEAVNKNDLNSALAPIEAALHEALTNDPIPADDVIRLTAQRQFVKYFSRLTTTDQDETTLKYNRESLAWLAQQPKLMKALCLAVGEYDSPDRVMGVFRALYRTNRETLENWPELTAALCVVWDQAAGEADDSDKSRGDWAVFLYRYFALSKVAWRYDLHTMPWQLQVYVVDLRISPEEMQWVWQKYKQVYDVGGRYFDVPYDDAAYYQGDAKKIEGRPYTLENLIKYGGVCGDQAYFATQVGRAMGVPATVITGQGGGGEVGHAWMGYLNRQKNKIIWDLKNGRYESQLYWTGSVSNPQTHKQISESETSLLAELQNTTPQQRDLSIALLRTIDMQPTDEAKVKTLFKALDLSSGNDDAWLMLADYGASGKMNAEQLNQVAEVVRKFAVKDYADLAFDIYYRIIAKQSNLEQLDKLDWMARTFAGRKDLVARSRLYQGRNLFALRRNDEAMKQYEEILVRNLDAGPIIMEALSDVDKFLHEEKRIGQLAAIYQRVMETMPKPTQSAAAKSTPYYIIGSRYVALLEDMGDRAKAATIQTRIDTFVNNKNPKPRTAPGT